MKILSIILLLILATHAYADKLESLRCFDKAWAHPGDGGLGLTRGQAQRLCKNSQNAEETIKCYEIAWGHPNNGGMGMTAGGATDFCGACEPSSRDY